MYYKATKILFEYAALLRLNETKEEKILWEYLRHSRLGVKFRRQHPISRFIVDFYCHQHKLVIEIDGKIHLMPEVKANDKVRENELKELGLRVIRFKNEDVRNELEMVLSTIKNELKKWGGATL